MGPEYLTPPESQPRKPTSPQQVAIPTTPSLPPLLYDVQALLNNMASVTSNSTTRE